MYQVNITLCGASAYEKKFYFNQDLMHFGSCEEELRIMCCLHRGCRRDPDSGLTKTADFSLKQKLWKQMPATMRSEAD